MRYLLGVDLGLSTGLALYEEQKLVWYRSRHFANQTILKRGIAAMLRECPPLDCLVLEGHRALAWRWKQAAPGVRCLEVSAETWRQELLIPRRRKDAETAKKSALEEAHRLIVASGLPRPTSLTHDAAEAILIGWWGVRQVWT